MDTGSDFTGFEAQDALSDRTRKKLGHPRPEKSGEERTTQIFPMCTESLTGGDHLTKFLMVCETDWESAGEEDHHLQNPPLPSNNHHSYPSPKQDPEDKTSEASDISDIITVDDEDELGFSVDSAAIVQSEADDATDGEDDKKPDILILESDLWGHKCPICLVFFSGIETLFQHTAAHQSGDLTSCKICLEGFSNRAQLEEHQRRHREFCLEDTTNVKIIEMVDARIARKSPPKSSTTRSAKKHSCRHCQLCFKTQKSLKLHLVTHSEKCEACVLCDQKFANPEHLMEHISKVHKGKKPFSCIYCQEDCSTLFQLKKHLSVHREDIDELHQSQSEKTPELPSDQSKKSPEETPELSSDQAKKSPEETPKLPSNQAKKSPEKTPKLPSDRAKKSPEKIPKLPSDPAKKSPEKTPDLPSDEVNKTLEYTLDLPSDEIDKSLEYTTDLPSDKANKSPEYTPDLSSDQINRSPEYTPDPPPHPPHDETPKSDISSENSKIEEAKENHLNLPDTQSCQVCEFCQEEFSSKEDLESHMAQHKPYACHLCPQRYRWRSNLKRHLSKHTSESKEKENADTNCPICLTDFSSTSRLKRHMRTHNSKKGGEDEEDEGDETWQPYGSGEDEEDEDENNTGSSTDVKPSRVPRSRNLNKFHPCTACEATFTNKRDLEKHMKEHPLICSQCQEVFDNQRALTIHLRHVHLPETGSIDRETFLCSVCGAIFLTKKGLRNHSFEHTGESKKYACKLCGRSMNTSSLLEEHMRRHRGEKPFMCDKCAKQFTTRSGLKIHQQCHSTVRPHICRLCGRGFGRAGSLRIHMSVHSGNRPYGCTLCSRTFNEEDSLKEHLKMHGGEKKYACKVCDKRFSIPQYLKQHEKIHLPIRPHRCMECEKTFSTPQGLYQHSKTHRNRPYGCRHCKRTFSHEQALDLHQASHAGFGSGRRHRCQVCEKCFSTPQGLYQHRRTHRDKAFQCNQCDQSFARLRELKKHFFSHRHDEKKEDMTSLQAAMEVDEGEEIEGETREVLKIHLRGRSKRSLELIKDAQQLQDVTGEEEMLIKREVVGDISTSENSFIYQSQMSDYQDENSFQQNLESVVADPIHWGEEEEHSQLQHCSVEEEQEGSSQNETTVYYEPTAGLLYFEQPELASTIIEDSNVQKSLMEIVERFDTQPCERVKPSAGEDRVRVSSARGEREILNIGHGELNMSNSGRGELKTEESPMMEKIYQGRGGRGHKVKGLHTGLRKQDWSTGLNGGALVTETRDETVEVMSSGESSSSSGDEWVEVEEYT